MKTYYNMILALVLLLSFIPVTDAVKFCDGDALVENISVNNVIVTISNVQCDFGCANWTWSTFGYPACEESDFVFGIIFLVVLFFVIFLIWVGSRG